MESPAEPQVGEEREAVAGGEATVSAAGELLPTNEHSSREVKFAEEQQGEEGPDIVPKGSRTRSRLHEIRENQKQRGRKRGISSTYLNPKDIQRRAEEEAEKLEGEEEEDEYPGYGLLQWQFTSTPESQNKPVDAIDKHLEAYLSDKLGKVKAVSTSAVASSESEASTSAKSRLSQMEANLYKIPERLQVKDTLSGEADKMNWVTGLVEVPLSLEARLRNIEATEKAKRELLKMDKEDPDKPETAIETITRRAFGARFQAPYIIGLNKGSSDDATVGRFRKQARKQ